MKTILSIIQNRFFNVSFGLVFLVIALIISLQNNNVIAQTNMYGAVKAECEIFNLGTIEGMSDSKILNLSNENLNGIPVSIFEMRELESLNLNNEKITSIPSDIRKLYRLRALTVGFNVTELPEEIRQLLLLKELYLPYEQWQYKLDDVRKITRAKIILY